MRPLRRHAFVVAIGLSLALAGDAPAAPEDDGNSADVYVRRRMDIRGTVSWVAEEARRLGAGQVIFVLDAATFAPPPGLTEFTSEYGFYRDLGAWVSALAEWPATSGAELRATSSLAPWTVPQESPRFAEELTELVQRRWFEKGVGDLDCATRWLTRLLARTEVVAGQRTGRPRMVVLVAGHLTPERWVPADVTSGHESDWRTRLPALGEYWDPVAVATTVQRARGVLYVVAPEARFGDFSPAPELPDLPWQSRPMYPPEDLNGLVARIFGSLAPGGAGRRVEAKLEQLLRAELEEVLRKSIPDPEARQRAVDEALERLRNRASEPTRPATGPARPRPGLVTTPAEGTRFISATPVWFLQDGAIRLWANHAPSGYGHWPLALAAARTGGRYLFYPFPESRWLDDCPRDEALLARLAPELVPFDRYVRRRAGDPALDAVCQATALLQDATPWADGLGGHRAASGWSAFRRASPLRLERDWFLRRRPYDDALSGSEDGMARLGARLREEALPAHERALEILDRAAAELGSDKGRAHPRALADLYLTRFGLAMSAFHLAAYGIFAEEIDRFVPESMRGHVMAVCVTYVPTIRMSDCLDAYDGRALTPEEEASYTVWEPAGAPGYQGNLLLIPEDDPRFRAKRALDRVLLKLDPRLRRPALRMIAAAEDVMARYARSGWGWTVYYADAHTFVFKPVEVPRGHQPTPGGGSSKTPGPTTPLGPGSSPGGSAPGGASTK